MCRIGGSEFREQGPVAVGPHRAVTAFHGFAKDRFLRQEPSPHAEPLRPLPWENENKFSSMTRNPAPGREPRTSLSPQISSQAFSQLLRGIAHHGETVVVVAPPHAGAVTDVVQGRRGLRACQEVPVNLSQGSESLGTACR